MHKITPNYEKSTAWRRFEFVLLLACLIIIGLRGTYIESLIDSPTGQTSGILSGPSWSIVITSTLMLISIAWWMISLSSRRVFYKPTGIEFGAILFAVASIWSIFDASNKRYAINYALTIIAVLSLAVLLLQLLDSQRRIRLLLMVIIAAGAANTWQCFEQYFFSNQILIEEYERNPEAQLSQLNIEPDSFEQTLYTHRLYSKDVRGFFTTGNSSAAFNIMAFWAVAALLLSECRAKLQSKIKILNISIYSVYSLWLLLGIILTHSKGGTGGMVFAGILFGVCMFCMKRLHKYCRILLITGIVLGLSAIIAIAVYGIQHDGIGGGNSMLVRWQYWQSTIQICKENFVDGVGGGNFASWYTSYKIPAALETVNDPHCFILSLICQYGIFGLIGFIAAVAVPMFKTAISSDNVNDQPNKPAAAIEPVGKWKHGMIGAIAVSAVLFVIRLVLINGFAGETAAEKIFMIFYLHIIPMAIFTAPMFLMWIAGSHRTESEQIFSKPQKVLILCGLTGVLIHNLIDFAIFEPGVMTMFMVLIACLCAVTQKHKSKPAPVNLNKLAAISGIAVCVVIAVMVMKFAAIPMAQTGSLKQKAMKGEQNPLDLLNYAIVCDRYNPEYLAMTGKMYLNLFMQDSNKNPEYLQKSQTQLSIAIDRDPHSFKNYEKLAQVYFLWAQTLSASDKVVANEKYKLAYTNLLLAVNLYPGSGRLNFKLAQICETLNKPEAIDYYQKTVDIENAYRAMFQKMYPGKPITSRLGEKKYQTAKQKLLELKKDGQ